MKIYMKQGWQLAVKHFHLIILLFLYQLLWGFFLYRFIDSVVSPLLRRFPADYPSDTAVHLFLTEAQFQLLKTDILMPYVWMLGGLFVIRMLLTPLFNAGLFYSLHHSSTRSGGATGGGGTKFIEGIRKAWKPVMLLYWLEAVLALAPAWWVLPHTLEAYLQGDSTADLLQAVLPGAGLWLLWGSLLHLLFLAMQLGAASNEGILHSLWRALRHIVSYAAISLVMWAIGAGLGLLITSVSLLWAGLFALVLHQGYNLVRTLVRVWTIASQYECLQSQSK
ncbi:hypothetical protein [Paenibacillus harenae]|uniref:hypothetical protein n=1 Tax=Paenibacillus harenae TaxID=306543 RepID=UPI00278F8856|nr:hypothetical protein [Paenibacillus harenae]MDQ0063886.1 hypothetical protein [Paenibacillus harenae]